MDKEHLERAIRHQNRIDGIAEGRAEEKRETAKKLLALAMDIQTIATITGLTPEEIQSL